MSTTAKDLYLAGHNAAIAAFDAGINANTSDLDSFDAARKAFGGLNFDKLDWPSFQSHFKGTIRKLAELSDTEAPSVLEGKKAAAAAANAIKIAAKKEKSAAKPVVPQPVKQIKTPPVKVVAAAEGVPPVQKTEVSQAAAPLAEPVSQPAAEQKPAEPAFVKQ